MRIRSERKMAAVEELLNELNSEGKDVLLLIREMSGFVSYYRRLLEKFELDSLTGLPGSNKYREFRANLEARPAKSVGVIVFDVNDLKYYNDNKGHHSGDLLLQKAAESFHSIAGKNVSVFRTGGDEFVAVAAGCAEADLSGIVASWQEKLAELNAAADGIACTVAHGVAFGSGEYRFGDILELADERMYAEKRRMKESGVKLGEVR
ncbi:MAG: GGDEF domain-containing protein [Chitinispirillales bacterium]|jgi:diguanylate cyclase (GGDEF)-like protein|nr:GGDEF domain-containing protein [Chitinispirillales bacterium]